MRPRRIVSLHQPLACVDYDGPAAPLARAMAAQSTLPVRKLRGFPGSLGSFAGDTLGIPIITMELPGRASRIEAEVCWREYGPMLLTAICYPQSPPVSMELPRGESVR